MHQRGPLEKPHLLLASANAPLPIRDGLTQRLHALSHRLADHYSLTLVAPSRIVPAEICSEDLPWTNRIVVPNTPQRDGYTECSNEDLQRALCNVQEHKPVAAIAWNLSPALIKSVFLIDQMPVLLDLVDSLSRSRWGELKQARTPGALVHELLNLFACLRQERDWLNAADLCYLVGEEDLAVSQKIAPSANIKLLRHGVQIPSALPGRQRSESPSIIFSGSLSFPPNIDAVLYFAREVFPQIREHFIDVQFWIVGREPHQDVEALQSLPGIRLYANVPSVETFLQKAWIAVAPMRSGSGVKIKILEAWAHGLTVIMTPHARNGLGPHPSMDECTANGSKGFAERVIRFLKEPELCRRVGDESFQTARDFHDWSGITNRLLKDLHTFCGRGILGVHPSEEISGS